jgi:hypothetical protein
MNSPSSAERSGDSSSEALHLATARLIRVLTEAEPDVLLGDEAKSGRRRLTGQMRTLENKADKFLSVAVYTEGDRNRMTEIVGRRINHDTGKLIGHLAIDSGEENGSGIAAAIYVGDKGIVANASFRHDPEEPGYAEAEERLDEATALGLGKQWTLSLLAEVRDQEQVPFIVPYDGFQTSHLNVLLATYVSSVDDA